MARIPPSALPHDPELEKGLARDAQRIVKIIEVNGRKDEFSRWRFSHISSPSDL